MPLTPNSSATAYLAPLDMLARFDIRLIADLCSDIGVRVGGTQPDVTSVATNTNLLAVLLDASGDLEAAVLRGGRYQPTDLTRQVLDGSISGTSFSSGTAHFSNGDIGGFVMTNGAVSSNVTIKDLLSPSSAVLSTSLGTFSGQVGIGRIMGAALGRQFRLVGRLAMCYLFERRPDKGAIPETYKVAWDHLDALANGEQIFGFVETQEAGVLQSEVETTAIVEARNLVSLQASRYYGRRSNRIPPPF